MTVAVLATLDAGPDQAGSVRDALLRLAAGTRDEPGTELFDVHEVTARPGSFVVFERYRDADAVTAHRRGPAVAQLRIVLGELGIAPEITFLTPLQPGTPTPELPKGSRS